MFYLQRGGSVCRLPLRGRYYHEETQGELDHAPHKLLTLRITSVEDVKRTNSPLPDTVPSTLSL
ncbi:hypothetical protein EYF80_049881 [Liparis tanakae]|uniref:Uncharacterized protein n=1 Tax=Liparis tanakae TaxID=230148 RepID=A0A4Z2FGD0_9TELE|nr:hypothetical protein EYF80_049881 [Liparis tanakae]